MEEEYQEYRHKENKFIRWMVSAVIVLALLLFFRTQRDNISRLYDYLFKPRTEVGHIQLSDLSKTSKLKVLSLYKEVIVSQYRKERGLLFYSQNESQIHSIYPGRVDIGFDLTKCDDNWLTFEGDTAVVTLPPVEILNKDGWYIDEAKKQTPIEEGTWTADDQNKLALRANALIKRTCELEDCYKQAETQGFKVISNLLRAFGYQNLKIFILTREQYKPYYIIDANTVKYHNSYQFYTDTNGSDYILFSNGAKLNYSGSLNDEELLAFIDMFNQYTIDQPTREWHITKEGNKLNIGITLAVSAGSTQASTAALQADQSRIIRIKNAAAMICPKAAITISLMDRGGKTLRDFN